MSTNHPYPNRWRALGVIATAQFLVIMDTSIIGVALPDMQESLGFSPSSLSWVFNAYVIALGGLLLLGGSCPMCSAPDVCSPPGSRSSPPRHWPLGSLRRSVPRSPPEPHRVSVRH